MTRDEQRQQIPGRGMTDWAYEAVGLGGALLCAAAILLVGAYFSGVRAHEDGAMSYPPRCCYGTPVVGDCAPIEGVDAVQFRQDGWFIVETGETIPFEKTEPSNDLRFHRCKKPDNTTRCFFAPGSGT